MRRFDLLVQPNVQAIPSSVLRALAIVVLAGISVSSWAQSNNGIDIGQPKVYDNQSLMIMLDQLNDRLTKVQVIDQQSLAKALGLVQGSQQQDISRSFSASVSMTPAAVTDTGSAKSTATTVLLATAGGRTSEPAAVRGGAGPDRAGIATDGIAS